MAHSIAAGRILDEPSKPTLSDGTAGGIEAGSITFGLCRELVERLRRAGTVVHPTPEEWGSSDERLVEHYRKWGLIWGGAPDAVRYSVAYDPADFKWVADQMVGEAGVNLRLHSWATDVVVDEDRTGQSHWAH